MICKNTECQNNLEFICCYDNPNTGFAFNIYFCYCCGTLYKEHVWKNKSLTICKPEDNLNEYIK